MINKWKSHHRWFGLIVCVNLVFLFATEVFAATFTLAWDANSEADLNGYGVYSRNASSGASYQWIADVYLQGLADRQNPKYTVTEIGEDGTYYLAVTAFNDAGAESARSGAVCIELSGSSVSECTASSGGGGGGGGGCFVSSAGNGSGLLSLWSFLGFLSLSR